MATSNPAAKSTKTTHTPPPGTTGGGTSGTTQTTTPPQYLYAIGRTTKSASNSYDTGTNTQEQAAHSQVSNPLSYETTESHYLNAGTSDHSSHLTAEAVSAGGDSTTTTSKDWSSDIESG